MSIRRLYEDFDPEQPENLMSAPSPVQSMDQMTASMPNQMGQEMDNSPNQMATGMPEARPDNFDQKALPDFDPMKLTISQFMERCDKINPLVCMGLRSFIEENRDTIAAETNGEEKFDLESDANLEFPPKSAENAPSEFSLNQPSADLNFPQNQPAPAEGNGM